MHGLDEANPAMAYVETEGHPWHGLGKGIRKGATIDEVEEAAKLGWRVGKEPVQFYNSKGELITDTRHNVIFREDTDMVLDVAGPVYVPHQNREVLEFFEEYLAQGEMFIDTAGAIFKGQYIWVQAKVDASFNVGQGDPVNGRVLLMNPHKYGKGMIAKVVMERVVCFNTLQMALREGGKSVMIPHTKEFNKERRDEAKRNLGIARERVEAFKADAKTLAATTLVEEDALELLIGVFDGKADQPLDQQGKTISRLMELYQGAAIGAHLKTADGTAWGLLNAVTQYFDHEYGRTQDARIQAAWFGHGDIKKREMLKVLLAEAA